MCNIHHLDHLAHEVCRNSSSLTDDFYPSVQIEKSVKEPKVVDKLMQELDYTLRKAMFDAVGSAITSSLEEQADHTGTVSVNH